MDKPPLTWLFLPTLAVPPVSEALAEFSAETPPPSLETPPPSLQERLENWGTD